MSEFFNPVIVITDGENPNFRSFMRCDIVDQIKDNGGLSQAEQVFLRETPDRQIPQCIKNGTAMIMDVWITLVPGPAFQG
jgi:hypothetical protein